MSIHFKNRDHERFYQQCLVRCGCGDPYHKVFFYTMGISDETRKHVEDVFDFQEDVIRPEGLNKGWQTSGSSCLTRLAFNLWNGWNEDGCATPYDLFSTSDASYMLEAIRIRWQKLLYMDAHTWQPFRPDYTARQLDIRFKLEEERAAQGLPLSGRAFFTALDDRLEQEGCPRRRNKE